MDEIEGIDLCSSFIKNNEIIDMKLDSEDIIEGLKYKNFVVFENPLKDLLIQKDESSFAKKSSWVQFRFESKIHDDKRVCKKIYEFSEGMFNLEDFKEGKLNDNYINLVKIVVSIYKNINKILEDCPMVIGLRYNYCQNNIDRACKNKYNFHFDKQLSFQYAFYPTLPNNSTVINSDSSIEDPKLVSDESIIEPSPLKAIVYRSKDNFHKGVIHSEPFLRHEAAILLFLIPNECAEKVPFYHRTLKD